MIENEFYRQLVDRNIGLLTWEQQKKLQDSCVAVFGLGGIGGVIAQLLVRSGVEKLMIADNDRFELTNLNRQIFAFTTNIDQLKVDATEQCLKEINPHVQIEKFTAINEQSVKAILNDAVVALMAIDKTKPCILISRGCRRKGIPLVEGWAIPFGNVRVYTKDTVALEEFYELPTATKSIAEIDAMDDKDFCEMDTQVLMTLASLEGIDDYYEPEVIEQMMHSGRISSFAPMVWLTSVFMTLEAVKIILGWGNLALAPHFAIYDPFQHKIPKILPKEIWRKKVWKLLTRMSTQ